MSWLFGKLHWRRLSFAWRPFIFTPIGYAVLTNIYFYAIRSHLLHDLFVCKILEVQVFVWTPYKTETLNKPIRLRSVRCALFGLFLFDISNRSTIPNCIPSDKPTRIQLHHHGSHEIRTVHHTRPSVVWRVPRKFHTLSCNDTQFHELPYTLYKYRSYREPDKSSEEEPKVNMWIR